MKKKSIIHIDSFEFDMVFMFFSKVMRHDHIICIKVTAVEHFKWFDVGHIIICSPQLLTLGSKKSILKEEVSSLCGMYKYTATRQIGKWGVKPIRSKNHCYTIYPSAASFFTAQCQQFRWAEYFYTPFQPFWYVRFFCHIDACMILLLGLWK